ncbi:nitroreductase/quinone reductase family protein [Thalassiella azotivora]
MANPSRYRPPTSRAERATNAVAHWLTAHGISLLGSRVLRVRGRRSGQWREVPVNPLELDGVRYLVAPRGVTQWVRNLRAAGEGELALGRRVVRFTATELADDAKVPVLRAYLRRWGWEVGTFFEGVRHDDPDDVMLAAARRHPVFVLHPA